jgi:hypothetical protein
MVVTLDHILHNTHLPPLPKTKDRHTVFSIPNVPDSLAREIYADLCRDLPPPSPDTPEARTARDERAMAAVTALIPENAIEAELAALIVAKVFHAKHALRDASRPNLTVDALNSYRNQASRMDRDSQSGLRNLLRLQAERRKAEDALRPAAMERAGYWFKDSLEMAGRPLPMLAPEPDDDAPPPGEPPRRVLSQMDPAEQFAAIYPQRAALIRAYGGLPPNINFGAPEPDLVAAIVASTSPIMLALDQEVATLTGISSSKTESRQSNSRDTDDTLALPIVARTAMK